MKKYKILIIINFVTFFVFVFSIYSYKSREKIIQTNNEISNYRILEYNCWGGRGGSSTIKINYNSKEYHIALAYNICEDLKNNNSNAKLYYDDSLDQVFHKTGLSKKMVVAFGCIFTLFTLLWFIPKKYL